MALSKRGKFFQYNFWHRGRHIQVATKFTNRTLAQRAENRHRDLLGSIEAGFPGAAEALAEFEAAMRGETLPAGPGSNLPTLSEYIPVFLAWSKTMHRRKTYDLHRSNCRALSRHLGDKRLDQITRGDVEAFMIRRKGEAPVNVSIDENGERTVRPFDRQVSNATVNRAVTSLRKLYHQAEGSYPELKNPTRGIELLPEDLVQRILSDEEWERYIGATRQPLTDVAILMHERGLRPQDACSLTCKSCDFERQTLELWPKPAPQRPQLVARRRSIEAGGKTANSSRTIVISPRVAEVIRRRIARARELGTEYLFPMSSFQFGQDQRGHRIYQLDRPMNPQSLIEPHREAWKRAGFTDRARLYDLRHTFGTNATRALMPLGVLQDILGHSDPGITRRYTQRNDLVAQRAAFAQMERTA